MTDIPPSGAGEAGRTREARGQPRQPWFPRAASRAGTARPRREPASRPAPGTASRGTASRVRASPDTASPAAASRVRPALDPPMASRATASRRRLRRPARRVGTAAAGAEARRHPAAAPWGRRDPRRRVHVHPAQPEATLGIAALVLTISGVITTTLASCSCPSWGLSTGTGQTLTGAQAGRLLAVVMPAASPPWSSRSSSDPADRPADRRHRPQRAGRPDHRRGGVADRAAPAARPAARDAAHRARPASGPGPGWPPCWSSSGWPARPGGLLIAGLPCWHRRDRA